MPEREVSRCRIENSRSYVLSVYFTGRLSCCGTLGHSWHLAVCWIDRSLFSQTFIVFPQVKWSLACKAADCKTLTWFFNRITGGSRWRNQYSERESMLKVDLPQSADWVAILKWLSLCSSVKTAVRGSYSDCFALMRADELVQLIEQMDATCKWDENGQYYMHSAKVHVTRPSDALLWEIL